MYSLSHNTMSQMYKVSREGAIGMLMEGMSKRAVARECNVNFSTISQRLVVEHHVLKHCFRKFVKMSNRLSQLQTTCKVPCGEAVY